VCYFFACPKKGRKREFESQPVRDQKKALCPMLLPAKPVRPSLGKEPYALFFWLVLRTAPHWLKINVLTCRSPSIHIIVSIYAQKAEATPAAQNTS